MKEIRLEVIDENQKHKTNELMQDFHKSSSKMGSFEFTTTSKRNTARKRSKQNYREG